MFKIRELEAVGSMVIVAGRTFISETAGESVIERSDGAAGNGPSWHTLDTQLRGDLRTFVENQTGISLDEVQLQAIFGDNIALLNAIEEWGVEDTDVAGQIACQLAENLLGRSWPTIGERDFFAEFLDNLRSAAVQKGYAVVVSTPSNLTIK